MKTKAEDTSSSKKQDGSFFSQRNPAPGENRIDGVNMKRGEGLPYCEMPFRPQPFTSEILASRHPEDGPLNNIKGVNDQRGEGLPYDEIQVDDNDIDLALIPINGM